MSASSMPKSTARRSPLEDLRRILPDLPERLRDVGRYLVEHEFDATTRSMRELALSAKLQPSAFTRLARAIGRKGWEELRSELIEARRPKSDGLSSSRTGRGFESVDGPNDPTRLIAAIQSADALSVGRVDVSSIKLAVGAVHRATRVWLAGYLSCRAVAELMHYQFQLFRQDVHLIGAVGLEDFDFGQLRKGDVIVSISFAPYTRIGVTTLRAARKCGCVTVSITDHPTSPYAEGADHCIVYDAGSTPAFFPSLTGAVCAAQALVAGVFKLGGDESAARLRDTEKRLSALRQHVSEEPKR